MNSLMRQIRLAPLGILFITVAVLAKLIAASDVAWTGGALTQSITDHSASVFKVYATYSQSPDVPAEGTAFVIHSSGDPENPTLWFLTAAHVILGATAKDDTPLDNVIKIEVRFGSAVGDVWQIDKKTVRIPQNWSSQGRDFAILKVISAGRRFKPLPIIPAIPSDKKFTVVAYPNNSPAKLTVSGTILSGQGDITPEPWIVVNAPFSHGMSGGPVLSSEGVFAIVEGTHETLQKYQCVVPISLAQRFIHDELGIPYTKVVTTDELPPAEIALWDTIKNSTDPEEFKLYLDKYPNGQFVNLAKTRFQAASEEMLKRGDTLYNQRQWAEAEGIYRKAVRLGVAPHTAQWHTNFGVSLYSQGKWAEAEVEFMKATQLQPDQPNWFYNLGLTQLQQKKWPEYEVTQRRLTELEPNNAGKHGDLAFALYNQKKFQEAEAAIRKAILLDPANPAWQELLKKITDPQNNPPPKSVEPDKLEFSIESADDRVEVYINGTKVGESSGGAGWIIVPKHLLKPGSNSLEIRVYNRPSFTGGLEIFGGHQREGWHYQVKVRSGDRTWEYRNSEHIPPPERHGKTFTVESRTVNVDERLGKISIQ